MLPPLQRNLKRCRNEYLLLLEKPYYTYCVKPPNFNQQVSVLCERIHLPPDEWLGRTGKQPLRKTPELPEPNRPIAPLNDTYLARQTRDPW